MGYNNLQCALKEENLCKKKSLLINTAGRGNNDANCQTQPSAQLQDKHMQTYTHTLLSPWKSERMPPLVIAAINPLHIYAPHVKRPNSINSIN